MAVTGGASASWGSDAISGVVNFVTEKKYEGFKANMLVTTTTYGDDDNATFQFARVPPSWAAGRTGKSRANIPTPRASHRRP